MSKNTTKNNHVPTQRAGIYCRVSTANQRDKGDSLAVQEQRGRAYCQANGLVVHQVYVDGGFSAKNTDRPELHALLNACERGEIDVVVVTSLDRISRGVRDADTLITFFDTHNIRFVSLRETIDVTTPGGRAMVSLTSVFAAMEREIAGERTVAVKRARAERGAFNGGCPPYGFTTRGALLKALQAAGLPEHAALKQATDACPEKGRLYPVVDEIAIVQRMFATFLTTNSLRKTCHALNTAGIRTHSGKIWCIESVRRILTSPLYLGKMVLGRHNHAPADQWRIVDGHHDPVIRQEDFDEVQRRLNSHQKPRRSGRLYLLSGVVRCGLCGGAMSGSARAATRAYYICTRNAQSGTAGCPGQWINADDLEHKVVAALLKKATETRFLQDKDLMLEELRHVISVRDHDAELT